MPRHPQSAAERRYARLYRAWSRMFRGAPMDLAAERQAYDRMTKARAEFDARRHEATA
jgi:hypothetical protein